MDDDAFLWSLPTLDDRGSVMMLDEDGNEVLDADGEPLIVGDSRMQIDPVDLPD